MTEEIVVAASDIRSISLVCPKCNRETIVLENVESSVPPITFPVQPRDQGQLARFCVACSGRCTPQNESKLMNFLETFHALQHPSADSRMPGIRFRVTKTV